MVSLAPQDIAAMDALVGQQAPTGLSPDIIAQMDKAVGVQQPQGQDLGAGYSALSGFNGAVPFGNRITAGIAAPIIAAANNPQSVSDFMDKTSQGYDQARQTQATTDANHPTSNLLGSLAGIATSLPIAGGIGNALKASELTAPVANYLGTPAVAADSGLLAKTGALLTNMGKGAVAAAPVGALYGAGAAPEGQQLQGAGQGAEIAGVLGGALPAAGAGLSALNESLGKTIIPSAADIKNAAQQGYAAAEAAGGVLKPEVTNQFVDSVQALQPQTKIGQIVAGDTPFTNLISKVAQIKDEPMSLQAAQELDEHLGDAVDAHTDSLTGRPDKQGYKILQIQNQLRDTIQNATPDQIDGGTQGFDALDQARQDWASSRQASDIERVINRANMTDNPATSMKNGFRTIASNPARLNSYPQDVQDAIIAATKDNAGVGALRTILGSRLIGTGVGAAAGSVGGPIGSALGAAAGAGLSSLARGAAGAAKTGQANNILEAIANNSSLGTTSMPLISSDLLKQLMGMPPAQAQAIMSSVK